MKNQNKLLHGSHHLNYQTNAVQQNQYSSNNRLLQVVTAPNQARPTKNTNICDLEVPLPKNSQPTISLTKRERESLFYTLCGKTAKEIALLLHLSKRTIEGHLISLKQKFSCQSKSELVAKAINLGYINFSRHFFDDFL